MEPEQKVEPKVQKVIYDDLQVKKAIKIIDQALDAEKLEKFEESQKLLNEGIEILEQQSTVAPKDKLIILNILIKNYKDQIDLLKQEQVDRSLITIGETLHYTNQTYFQEDFEQVEFKNEGFAFPDDKSLKTLFILKQIGKSVSEGAYITNELYISKYVWKQDDINVPGIAKKIEYLGIIIEEMKKLKSLYSHRVIINQNAEFDEFILNMNTIQDILVNEFDFGNLGISKKEESAFSKISEKIKNIAEKNSEKCSEIK